MREYEFAGHADGTEKAVFDLVKGGLRTITGVIGRGNQENYQVETPVATIGIRGTHYGLRFCEQQGCGSDYADGLYGGVADGAIGVVNAGGDLTFGNDRYFYVANRNTAATELLAPPAIIFDDIGPRPSKSSDEEIQRAEGFRDAGAAADEIAWLQTLQRPAEQPVYVESDHLRPKEEDNGNGGHGETLPGNPAPNGSVALVAFKAHDPQSNRLWVSDALKQQNGYPVRIDKVNETPNVVTGVEHKVMAGCAIGCRFDSTDWTLAEQGQKAGPAVTWGRWQENWLKGQDTTTSGIPYASLHFIYSNELTLLSDLDALKSKGIYAYFSPLEGTLPTDQYGNPGVYAEGTPNLKVDFGRYEFQQYNLGVLFPEREIAFSGELAQPTPIAGVHTALPLRVACSGCATREGTGHADVAFVGGEASHAMTSFEMHGNDQQDSAVGVALLYQSSSGGGTDNGGTDNGGTDNGGTNGGGTDIQGAPATAGIVVANAFSGKSAAGANLVVAASVVQGSDRPIYVDTLNNVSGVVTHVNNSPMSGCAGGCGLDKGSGALAESGRYEPLSLTWGRWSRAWELLENDTPATASGSWHFIGGSLPTSVADLDYLRAMRMYAYYDPVGGTLPTDENGNLGAYESYSPRMTVDFGRAEIVEYYVGVYFSNLSFRGALAAPVGFSSAHSSLPLAVSCGGCATSSASGSADVTFVGANASHAMNAFEMHSSDRAHSAVGVQLLYQASTYTGGPPTR